MTDIVNISDELINDFLPVSKKLIGSGRSTSKLVFADDDTPNGRYVIDEIRIGAKGVTLITKVVLNSGKLAFFESHGSPLAEYLLDSSNSITTLTAIVKGEIIYEFAESGGYLIDSKMWKNISDKS